LFLDENGASSTMSVVNGSAGRAPTKLNGAPERPPGRPQTTNLSDTTIVQVALFALADCSADASQPQGAADTSVAIGM
jgi:hypothetical protein